MNPADFLNNYISDSLVQTISSKLIKGGQKLQVRGLCGSLDAIITASCFFHYRAFHLIILHDKEEAHYFHNDIQALLPDREILFYTSSYKRPYEFTEIENANVLMRAEVLNKILQNRDPGMIIVTFPDALSEKVINKRSLIKNSITIKKGTELDLDFLTEMLHAFDFEMSDFVYEAGQFSIRGGILDIYSYANEKPFRIELAGNTVESIRIFNPENQISISETTEVHIIPNIHIKLLEESRASFLSFIPDNACLWIKDWQLLTDVVEKYFKKSLGEYEKISSVTGNKNILLHPDQIMENPESLKNDLNKFNIIEFGTRNYLKKSDQVVFNSASQPSFNKNFSLLAENLQELHKEGYRLYIASESEFQIDRLNSIFNEIDPFLSFTSIPAELSNGFVDHTSRIALYTDHQVFDRFHKFRSRNYFSKSKALTLRELRSLQPGDYITHIDYGIGKFVGLDRIEINGHFQDALRIIYKDDDLLYLSVQSLHKISKYAGKEGTPPVMSKLGSGEWEAKKRSIKKKVRDIAEGLIKLYAKRRSSNGISFKPDIFLQAELESSFIYEDTPDQSRATQEVKKDMEKLYPMDRLICGDVGFGKTEIAIRAAFLAVTNNKQVAILVPTTILAFQHYRTFTERLSPFPVTVEYLSRFRSNASIKNIMEQTAQGKIDILIGTHRLLNKELKFKDLGLLIIDEEQKFGVSMKEKLKELKVNVDSLTLTATPIPRTLQFSLLGARDLSIISTPPPNRQPVTTEIHTFNEAIIRDSISFELRRQGQVFFVHNRIQDIIEIANNVLKLVPDAKIAVAHGQMKGDQLERIMLKYIEGEYNVLVSTNIIESGLDIPNANTIIINRAHTFGLSDLHQMRGRVGRSNKKAYCYLLTPPVSSLSSDARKRLIALEEFSELGDGFKVAMRDLDIRGAGNLLGAEQSGFINDLGFDAYHKILDEAISELKEIDYKDLFETDLAAKIKISSEDCIIETDFEMMIPEFYVSNISERLNIYSQLDNINNEAELNTFLSELKDRFGTMPPQVITLAETVRMRWMAEKLGFEKLTIKNSILKAYLKEPDNSIFYNSEIFAGILDFIARNAKICRLKEDHKKPILIVSKVNSINKALEVLGGMLKNNLVSVQ